MPLADLIIIMCIHFQIGAPGSVQFAGVMESQPAQALSQTAVVGIVIGAVGAIVLVAVLLVVLAVVSLIKTLRKKRRSKAESADYTEVSGEDGESTNFSSNWQPMKVNTKGDYTAVPSTFSGNSNNTAL